jgi:TonB family protein
MKPSSNRLAFALLIALLSHLLVIWPLVKSPDLIPIPSDAYSIDVELSPLTTDNTSLETSSTPDQSAINSKQQQATQALEHPIPEQSLEQQQSAITGREDASEKVDTQAAQTAITTPVINDQAAKPDLTHEHQFNTEQNTQEPAEINKSKGINTQQSIAEVITEEPEEPQQKTAIISSQPQKQSENADAAAQITIDTSVATQPLTATERYEATIYAWILNRPDSKIFSASSASKLAPVIIKTTWWRNGTVIFTKIIQSSGDPRVDQAFQRTILTASPLPAIPSDIEGSEYTLNIRQGFID